MKEDEAADLKNTNKRFHLNSRSVCLVLLAGRVLLVLLLVFVHHLQQIRVFHILKTVTGNLSHVLQSFSAEQSFQKQTEPSNVPSGAAASFYRCMLGKPSEEAA